MTTERIDINPAVMMGKPVIRGTRITVELLLRKLDQGASEADLLQDYPHLTTEDIRAADGLMGGRTGTGPRIIPDRLSVHEALRYVWSLPVSTLVSGMASVAHLKANVASARSFVAMPEAERQALIAKVADVAQTGEMERGFKGQTGS
jgi:uncharacterized protein (DUF433 family)